MYAITLSFAACLGWGVADFLAGVNSRRIPALTVIAISNLFGALVISGLVMWRGEPVPHDPDLLWAVGGGVSGLVAMFLLYRGLAEGPMSIVTPLGGMGVILPVALGVMTGDRLSMFQMIGIPVAVVGTVLAVREKGGDAGGRDVRKAVRLALGSAVAVGFFLIFMDRASAVNPYWAALVMRISCIMFLLPCVLYLKPSMKVKKRHLPSMIALGTLDTLAGFAFAMATTVGMLSLVSVVGSLFPVITILLSTVLLRERLCGSQFSGVFMAIAGVVFISL